MPLDQAVEEHRRRCAARRDRYDAAQAELSGLAPARSVGELQAEIDRNLARLGHDCTTIEDKVSGHICKTVAAGKAELGRAERRAKLEAILAKPLQVSLPRPTATLSSRLTRALKPCPPTSP